MQLFKVKYSKKYLNPLFVPDLRPYTVETDQIKVYSITRESISMSVLSNSIKYMRYSDRHRSYKVDKCIQDKEKREQS